MNARASENYLAISRSSSASKSVEIFWAEIYWGRLFFRAASSLIQSSSQIKFTTKNSTILMNAFFCSFYTPIRFIQNVLRSTLLHTNKTTKKCIQFLNKVLILTYCNISVKNGRNVIIERYFLFEGIAMVEYRF
jgi:hypothetical protein